MAEEKKEFNLNNFHPQAFLLYAHFSDKNLKKSNMGLEGDKILSHKIIGNYRPQSVMSKIYNARDASGNKLIKANFFNLETYKISALVPELRFYKVEDDVYQPFYFPISTIADESAIASGNSRTKGSGILDFQVEFTGTNPYEAPRFLEAGLNLYVDNLANLFDKQPGYAPLADLFTISIAKSAIKKEIKGSSLSSGDYSRPIEVAATLGYVIPSDRMGIFTQEEIDEIQSSNLSLRMNVKHHEISVNQDGSATIKVDYTARIDVLGRNKIYSAIDKPIDLLKRANIRQLFEPTKKDMESTEKNGKDTSQGTTRKNQIVKMIEMRELANSLERLKKIHSIDSSFEGMLEYAALGDLAAANELPEPTPDDIKKPPQAPGIDVSTGQHPVLKAISDLDNSLRKVHYITFGDMVEAFMLKTIVSLSRALTLLDKSRSIPESIIDAPDIEQDAMATSQGVTRQELIDLASFSQKTEDEKQKIAKTLEDALRKMGTFKVLMADVEYKHYQAASTDESVARINISDIPISLELYQHFMFEKIANSYKNTYTLPDFLEDCVQELLPKAFGKDWSSAGIAPKIISVAPSFTTTTYTGPNLRKSIKKGVELTPDQIPSALKNFRASNIKDEDDYFVIYQSVDRELAADQSGLLDEDSKAGIYHFLLGKNRGLIKEINFSRFDVEFAQEQLMTNQVGLYDELRLPYKASIRMVGNNLFIPGSQIFINPNNIGMGSALDINSPAFRIGLGGYYTVLTVGTGFNGESLETILECSFGSHAKDSEGLSGVLESVVSNMESTGLRSNNFDSEPQQKSASDTKTLDVSETHYKEQIQSLRSPLTGAPVADDVLARKISNDYILHQRNTTTRIPGVLDKSINPNSGAVRYNLIRGQIIEIDDSRPITQAVRLVRG